MKIMSDSIKSISKALVGAQSKITNVKKGKEAYGYKYAELVDCLEMIKKPLSESDLSLVQLLSMTEDKSPVLVTLLTHTSGEWIKSEFPIKAQPSGKTNEMQALGSGITYLRRYAICSMLGIAQEDDDGSSAGEKGNSNSQVNIAASRNTLTMKNNDKWSSTNHNWAKILQNLCKEYSIEVKDFAQYHKITSSDADSVQNAVENFDSLMDAFITRSS